MMMNSLWIWFVAACPMLLELTQDYVDHKNDRRDKKAQDVMGRGILIWLAGIIMYGGFGAPSVWQSMGLSLGIFVFFFDYIIAYLLTKSLKFLGSTSKSDRFLKRFSPKQLLLARGLFFASTVAIYYLI